MIRLGLCLLVTWSFAAQAISENDYERKMKEDVLPFFAQGEQGQLTAFDGKKFH